MTPTPDRELGRAVASRGLGPVLFVCLLVATLVVSALVVRARTPDLMLEVTRMPGTISPDGDGSQDRARITFFVREDEPRAEVQIVGADKEVVRTLDERASLRANREVTYLWGGRTDAGGLAPPSRYRLRVIMPGSDRDMVFPRRLDLVVR